MGEKNVILEHVMYKDDISRNEGKVKIILEMPHPIMEK